MTMLRATLIDVGWGDSILLETSDGTETRYGLIDSNDTETLRSSHIYLKKFFERRGIDPKSDRPLFDFVLLSHAHTDHGQGLKAIIRDFGTKWFWYPQSLEWSSLGELLRFANKSSSIEKHQSIDESKILPPFGNVALKVLWPQYGGTDPDNENNNSVVLAMKFGNVSFLLTGDAEREVWREIAATIPGDTLFFKVPHHGSINGTLETGGTPLWLDHCSADTLLGISSHVRPFKHPHREVIDLLETRKAGQYFRTDEQYHLTFTTDGTSVEAQYSHI